MLTRSFRTPAVASVLAVLLLIQQLFPLGVMPSGTAERGGLLQLCPSVFPAAVLGGHPHHHEHAPAVGPELASEDCQFESLLGANFLPAPLLAPVLQSHAPVRALPSPIPLRASNWLRPRLRAPPATSA